MPSAPIHVFFFRGLSTYGHDNAKWSVFDFGPIYKHFARAFAQRNIEFHPVLRMGAGGLLEVAERARESLERHPIWQQKGVPVHFLGHSAGGLVARLVAENAPPEKLLSCMTVASPHHGAQLAHVLIDMPEKYRGSARLLRTLGYNVASRKDFFSELTDTNINKVFAGRSEAAGKFRAASIVCHSPRQQWCRPLKLFYKVKAFDDFTLPSDGVVERDTQTYGDVIAELPIDHFRQVGLFGEPHLFSNLCDVLYDFFKKSQ